MSISFLEEPWRVEEKILPCQQKKQARRGWGACPESHSFGGKETFTQVCYSINGILLSTVSYLTVFQFWFWWKHVLCCMMCLWVGGDQVVEWMLSVPHSDLPSAGTPVPRYSRAGPQPLLAAVCSRALPWVTSPLAASGRELWWWLYFCICGTKFSTHTEARAAFWNSGTIFIVFSHTVYLESVEILAKVQFYFSKCLIKMFC